MIETWKDLTWWNSGEYQVTEEKLDDLDKHSSSYCPAHSNLYAALDATPYANVRLSIMGQDPYPDPKFATGIAFSIPASLRKYPPTLEIMYEELQSDLHCTRKNGDLRGWCDQGVLLWNVIPTCLAWKSMSHAWTEWTYLAKEIVERLSEKGIVFVFLGRVAQEYQRYVTPSNNRILVASHPSKLGARSGRHPFLGSRLFRMLMQR